MNDVMATHPLKDCLPMETTPSGRVIFVSAEHPRNAKSPIDSTTLPSKMISSSAVHPWNAYASMYVTEAGIVIDFKEVHPAKANSPINVTVSGSSIASTVES